MRNCLLLILLLLTSALFSLAEPIVPVNINEADAGTEENPYEISSLGNLLWLSENESYWNSESSSSWYIQTSDIDAGETTSLNEGAGFNPIGYKIKVTESDEIINKPFYGHYNGNGYKINSLFIRNTDYLVSTTGLFGYAKNSTFTNISLTNTDLTGNNFVGGVAGLVESCEISKCMVSGDNEGFSFVGGVAGFIRGSIVEMSYSLVTIACSDNGGGLIGATRNSTIENSFYRGEMANASLSGGLVGNVSYSSVITNCYATSTISVGSNGGLVFSIMGNSSISNSFWNSEVSGLSGIYVLNEESECNDCQGLSTDQMKQQDSYLNAGWDFTSVWSISQDVNDGYPFLNDFNVSNQNIDLVTTDIESSAYPNPFNPTTTIEYNIPKSGNVEIIIYNIKGQKVVTLLNSNVSAGVHKTVWNGRNNDGNPVASGTYFYNIKAHGSSCTEKLVLMK